MLTLLALLSIGCFGSGCFGKAEVLPNDADGDGYTGTVDCDDGDSSIHPNAEEVWYDRIDQDCDGSDVA